jgi:hypothetical protein
VRLKKVIAGALGECVHVAGVYHFLQLAEQAGWRPVFLGPAVDIQQFIKKAVEEKADLVGVSYWQSSLKPQIRYAKLGSGLFLVEPRLSLNGRGHWVFLTEFLTAPNRSMNCSHI